MKTITENRQDVYTRITSAIVAALENGTRPWMRPWTAEHAVGRITRPLRHDGQPYAGINVLSLCSPATADGFTVPIWMTYRPSTAFNAHVRPGATQNSEALLKRTRAKTILFLRPDHER